MDLNNIDLNAKISKYFTYREALWLPHWNRAGGVQDGLTQEVLDRLTKFFKKMDQVREFIGKAVIVHVAWRPEKYNKEIKGAPDSAHKADKDDRAAADFNVAGMADGASCDKVRSQLEPKLEEFGMRMEQRPGSIWIHLDTKEPSPNRVFNA